MANRAKTGDYVVGYRRPPKATQFQPGHSGNPRGRPKGTRSVAAILNGILQQRVAVTEGGKTRRMPTLEVMLRRLVNDAMRSDAPAVKLLLTLVDRYADGQDAAIVSSADMLAEDRAILAQYLRGANERIQDAVSTSRMQADGDDV